MEGREEDGVLPRLVRRVHAHELAQLPRQVLLLAVRLQPGGDERQDPVGDPPPRLVLRFQRVDEIQSTTFSPSW